MTKQKTGKRLRAEVARQTFNFLIDLQLQKVNAASTDEILAALQASIGQHVTEKIVAKALTEDQRISYHALSRTAMLDTQRRSVNEAIYTARIAAAQHDIERHVETLVGIPGKTADQIAAMAQVALTLEQTLQTIRFNVRRT